MEEKLEREPEKSQIGGILWKICKRLTIWNQRINIVYVFIHIYKDFYT